MSLEFTLKEKMPAGDLLSKNTDQLYELLGLRIKAVEEDPEISGQIELKVEYSDHMGPMDDLKKIGLRMFNKVHTQVYELFCGSNPDDEEDRDKILAALKISWEATLTAITGILITTFGLGAAFAGVLATLIIKRFAQPAVKEGHKGLCEYWKEYLPQSND